MTIVRSFRRPLLGCPFALLVACGEQPQTGSFDGSHQEAASVDQMLIGDEHPGRPSARKPARTPAIVRRLEHASDGLLFMSESDHPFRVLFWKRPSGVLNAARVAELAGEDPAGPIEERTLDEFFEGATRVLPEYGAEELAVVERYRALVQLIRRELCHVKVFRYGVVEIHAYVTGVTRQGDWVALATTQIET